VTTGEYWLDSVNGDDAAAGTSEATAWKTASKLSTFAAANPFAIRGVRLRYGSTFTTSIMLPSQGHPAQFLRVRPYGNSAAGNPTIAITAGSIGVGALDFDSSLAVWVEDLIINGGAVAYAPGIAVKSFAYPERASPLRIERVNISNTGYDAITASFSGSTINTAFGYSAGSNQQNAGIYIADVTMDKIRNDGVSLVGSSFGAIVERITGTNIGTGTATPIDGNSGDFLTCHDFAGQITFRDSEVDGCINGIQAINFGAPSLIDGVRIKNATENCIALEMWEETHGSVQERLYWVIRNCILNQPATATGLAAVTLGRASVDGSLISADFHNNVVNNQDATPALLAYYAADARSDECFLNVQNNAFIRGHASGKHVEVQRNGRTPRVYINNNRYDVDAASVFKRDSTTYSFAGWQSLGYDASSSVGSLGLTGDPASSFTNARPLSTSALRSAGANLAPTTAPFYGYALNDHDGYDRPVSDAWDIGAIQFRYYAGTPVRDQIVAAIKTAFESIGTGVGYWATVSPVVYRDEHQWTESSRYPSMMLGVQSEEYALDKYSSMDSYGKTLTIKCAYFDQYDAATYSADQWRAMMVADVETSLADWTLGGLSTSLVIVDSATEIVEPSDYADKVLGVSFTIKVTYKTRRNDPTAKV